MIASPNTAVSSKPTAALAGHKGKDAATHDAPAYQAAVERSLRARIEALQTSNDELHHRLQRFYGRPGAVSTYTSLDLESFLESPHSSNPTSSMLSRSGENIEIADDGDTDVVPSAHIELLALKDENLSLNNTIRSLEANVEQANTLRARATGTAEELKDQLADTRKESKDAKQRLAESLKTTRENYKNTSLLWKEARKYFSVFRQGLLYDEIDKSNLDLSADVYLCLLPSTVPAGNTLRKIHGGRVICDCVENVEAERHSLPPKLNPAALELTNLSAYGSLLRADGLMTVSNAVASTLERYGPPIRVQPNYRRFEEPTPESNIRERYGLPQDSTVLVTTGNVVNGFENIVDALAQLPTNTHILSFIKLSPPEYEAKVREHIANRKLEGRVHLHPFLPYDELTSVLSAADVGLIALDPSNPNHSVSLPNRVFDFTTSTLPFVVPQLSEISAYVRTYNCGVTIPDVTPSAWATGIQEVLDNRLRYRESMIQARREAAWERLDDGLVDFLGNPRSVTLLGFRDLTRYQRFLRITDSLTARGIQVKAAFFSENPLPIANSDAEYYHFSDRYGRGSGLTRVPTTGEILRNDAR